MKHKKSLERHKLLRKSRQLERERAALAKEERERRVSELIAEGMKNVEELDPIIRETFKDDPKALAEWDEIMHMLDDPEEELEK